MDAKAFTSQLESMELIVYVLVREDDSRHGEFTIIFIYLVCRSLPTLHTSKTKKTVQARGDHGTDREFEEKEPIRRRIFSECGKVKSG